MKQAESMVDVGFAFGVRPAKSSGPKPESKSRLVCVRLLLLLSSAVKLASQGQTDTTAAVDAVASPGSFSHALFSHASCTPLFAHIISPFSPTLNPSQSVSLTLSRYCPQHVLLHMSPFPCSLASHISPHRFPFSYRLISPAACMPAFVSACHYLRISSSCCALIHSLRPHLLHPTSDDCQYINCREAIFGGGGCNS